MCRVSNSIYRAILICSIIVVVVSTSKASHLIVFQPDETEQSFQARTASSLVSPLGGETINTGQAIKISWHTGCFPKTAKIAVRAWNVKRGEWSVLKDNVNNDGITYAVLNQPGETRIEIVNKETGANLGMHGYINVREYSTSRESDFHAVESIGKQLTILSMAQIDVLIASFETSNHSCVKLIDFEGRVVAAGQSIHSYLSKNPSCVIVRMVMKDTTRQAPPILLLIRP